jgi:hypothetical protein
MPSRVRLRRVGLFLGAALFVMGMQSTTYADPPLQSSHYTFTESTLGTGGLFNSSSTNYKADSSTGDVGVGNSSSVNYNFSGGSRTTDDPALAVTVNGTANFGDFSAASAATASSTFTVSNYTSYGYVVNIAGTAPSSNGHTIAAMTAANSSSSALSTPGFEQFGINLVANTSPNVGANPSYGYFAFGNAGSNYNNPNHFRYVSGETIASAPKSSGVTTYTISYLANVGALTPGGQYTANQTLIVTGTY